MTRSFTQAQKLPIAAGNYDLTITAATPRITSGLDKQERVEVVLDAEVDGKPVRLEDLLVHAADATLAQDAFMDHCVPVVGALAKQAGVDEAVLEAGDVAEVVAALAAGVNGGLNVRVSLAMRTSTRGTFNRLDAVYGPALGELEPRK